jgi:hypothetical protein
VETLGQPLVDHYLTPAEYNAQVNKAYPTGYANAVGIYDGAFVIEEEGTIKVWGNGFDQFILNGGISPIQYYAISITSLASGKMYGAMADKGAGIYDLTDTITITSIMSADGQNIRYKWNDDLYTSGISPLTIPMGVGELTWQSYDDSGNYGPENIALYNVTAWTDYTGSIPIQEGTLEWYSVDAAGNIETLNSATYILSNIKTTMGLPGGLIRALNGANNGILKKLVSGSWQ